MKKCVFIISAVIILLFMQAMIISNEPSNKQELGELLFFDPILSIDSTISCATCHKPQFAFADSSATSRGVGGIHGLRNTPSAMNVAMQRNFFWDGRAKTLEEQALAPIENPNEMNLPICEALQRLKKSESYNSYFKKIFKDEPTRSNWPVSRTRKSFAWRLSGRLAISSRKSVPPSASSNLPMRSVLASVKAPRT